MNAPTQEHARRYVEANVIYCQSSLIDKLLADSDPTDFTVEEITNFYDETPAAVDGYLMATLENDDWRSLSAEERRELADAEGFEPEPHEIYEWWIVTDHMAEALEALGQPLLQNDYGTWWGRTTTGQSVCMDGVIVDILTRRR